MCIVYIMTRMQVYLPDDVYAELRIAARLSKRPMSEFVRKGLGQVLKLTDKNRKNDPFKFFVGKGKTMVKTNALEDFGRFYAGKLK